MIDMSDVNRIEAPVMYQDWLFCLGLLRKNVFPASELYSALTAGTFSGSEKMTAALQRQIVDSVNALLNNSAAKFIRNLNESIAFNELYQVDLLFKRLKKDVSVSLFFEKLEFLPQEFRSELSDAVRKQMSELWNETKSFLYEQMLECSSSELEDALFLINRIKLFE